MVQRRDRTAEEKVESVEDGLGCVSSAAAVK
jgi:hypothetical protein